MRDKYPPPFNDTVIRPDIWCVQQFCRFRCIFRSICGVAGRFCPRRDGAYDPVVRITGTRRDQTTHDNVLSGPRSARRVYPQRPLRSDNTRGPRNDAAEMNDWLPETPLRYPADRGRR